MANPDLKARLNFEAYGVRIGVRVNDERAIDKIKKILPVYSTILDEDDSVEHDFSLIWGPDETQEDVLFRNGEEEARRVDTDRLIALLDTCFRMTIGESAPRHIFIHAGVVGWNGRAIVFPGNSYSGKTTLVAELVKNGAVYYSDEYAVIDENGLAYPYPKPLSMRREGEIEQTDRPVEELGGVQGIDPIPVGLVFLTEFDRLAKWSPEVLSAGRGAMEILPHALAINTNPKFVLKVLNLLAERAIIATSKRGESSSFAKLLLNFPEFQFFA